MRAGDLVRLPSGECAVLEREAIPDHPEGAPPGTRIPRAWRVSGHPYLLYFETELRLEESRR